MNVNSSVNMMGITVTSNSWNGTCLILSIARHASVSTVDGAGAGCGRTCMRSSWWVRSPDGRASLIIA
jgi:hypothetical protein